MSPQLYFPCKTQRGLFVFLALAAASFAQAASYTAVNLGSLGGSSSGTYANATGINDLGTVTGQSYASNGSAYGFIYANSPMTELTALDVGASPYAINNAGVVVGFYAPTGGATYAFSYSNGTPTDLGTLGGSSSSATAINDSGTIVGYSTTSGSLLHAFSYSGSTMTDLGTLGGSFSRANGINSSGTIVGYADTTGTTPHAFSYSGGTMTDLGTLGGSLSQASAINGAGVIVGYADTTNSAAFHAFSYSGVTMTDLGTLGGSFSQANAINSAGVIVGYADTSGGVQDAFIYSAGTMTDLNTLVTMPAGVTLSDAVGINDLSQIVVLGSDGYSYLLTPTFPTIPGPPGAVAAVAGIRQATVSFSAPANTGGVTITGYTVTATPNSGSPVTATGTSSPIIVTGLANGITYAFTVTASNSVGTGPASLTSTATLPAVPGPPTGVSALAGNGRATVSFSAPASTGGAPITGYTVTATPNSGSPVTATGTSSPITVNGLANGTAYDFTVAATNGVGTGAASSASEATPATVPDAPTGVSAAAGNGQVTVNFSAPANTGGATITGYTVTATPNSGSPVTATGTSSPITVNGLANGTTYGFTVTAANSVGTGAASSVSTATPVATLPDAPTGVSAVAGDDQATVSFSAPVNTGGSVITGYTVTATSSSGSPITATGISSPIVVMGLTDGTTYTFTVSATTMAGTGASSPASPPATPFSDSTPAPAFTLSASPSSVTVANGRSAVFNVIATGTPRYQWTLNGSTTIPGATGTTDSVLLVTGATSVNDGTYTCTATNAGGSVQTSATLAVATTATPGYLTNLSSRVTVGTGGNILIAGFVIAGSGSMDLLLRGVGPALIPAPFGVSGALTNTQLTLYDTVNPNDPLPIVTNSGWSNAFTRDTSTVNVAPQAATLALMNTLGAFTNNWAVGSPDSALEVTPPVGGYTAQIGGVGGATGIALAEIYDADAYNSATRLVNLSTRAQVGTGGNILIGGFVISGSTAETLLIRAVGPTLAGAPYSVPGTIAQPVLTIYAGSTPIYANSNWGGDSTISTAINTVGAFPLNPSSADAALLITLPPASNYTAQVSGVNNTTGVALVEIYEVY